MPRSEGGNCRKNDVPKDGEYAGACCVCRVLAISTFRHHRSCVITTASTATVLWIMVGKADINARFFFIIRQKLEFCRISVYPINVAMYYSYPQLIIVDLL